MALFAVSSTETIDGAVSADGSVAMRQTSMTGTTSHDVDRRPHLRVVIGSLVLVVAVAGISWLLWKGVEPADFAPRSDYTALAGVVLLATAIERFLEPISRYLMPADEHEQQADEAKAEAVNTAADHSRSQNDKQQAVTAAANALSVLRRRKSERAILFWSVSTSLAMLVGAATGVFCLRVVSTSSSTNRFLDLVLTGLIVGSGTKPTHDLISQLEASKNKTKTDSATAST
jgi:hypothetical protein